MSDTAENFGGTEWLSGIFNEMLSQGTADMSGTPVPSPLKQVSSFSCAL